MEITGVDPRDAEWGIEDPKYRVYFHDAGANSDEYEIVGADVTDVLAWAEANRGERTFVLYACVTSTSLGLLRLAGHDPNER